MLKIETVLRCVAVLALIGLCKSYKVLTSVHDANIKIDDSFPISLNISGKFDKENGTIKLKTQHADLIEVIPNSFPLNSNPPWNFCIKSLKPGHDVVTAVVDGPSKNISVDDAFIRVTLLRSHDLVITSNIIGWLYFAAWSISFYPQVYENWKRKSVVGLNFDFLALNLMGFMLYSMYNCGLYWITAVQDEYYEHYPKGLIPVQLNDIVFSLHAVIITILTIVQCFIYERAEQKVSLIAKLLLGAFGVIFTIALILSASRVTDWLIFLNICGYIKLTITLIKYLPQAYMNYKRKSTVGWSIGNVLLDFTGGILSMIQMIINADNYDDWASIFGDVTKFGLGLFSVVFDMFFVLQHYVFYRNSGYSEFKEIEDKNKENKLNKSSGYMEIPGDSQDLPDDLSENSEN